MCINPPLSLFPSRSCTIPPQFQTQIELPRIEVGKMAEVLALVSRYMYLYPFGREGRSVSKRGRKIRSKKLRARRGKREKGKRERRLRCTCPFFHTLRISFVFSLARVAAETRLLHDSFQSKRGEEGKKQAARHFCQSGHVFLRDEESTFSPRWSEHVLALLPLFRDDPASCARYRTLASHPFRFPDIGIPFLPLVSFL